MGVEPELGAGRPVVCVHVHACEQTFDSAAAASRSPLRCLAGVLLDFLWERFGTSTVSIITQRHPTQPAVVASTAV